MFTVETQVSDGDDDFVAGFELHRMQRQMHPRRRRIECNSMLATGELAEGCFQLTRFGPGGYPPGAQYLYDSVDLLLTNRGRRKRQK